MTYPMTPTERIIRDAVRALEAEWVAERRQREEHRREQARSRAQLGCTWVMELSEELWVAATTLGAFDDTQVIHARAGASEVWIPAGMDCERIRLSCRVLAYTGLEYRMGYGPESDTVVLADREAA